MSKTDKADRGQGAEAVREVHRRLEAGEQIEISDWNDVYEVLIDSDYNIVKDHVTRRSEKSTRTDPVLYRQVDHDRLLLAIEGVVARYNAKYVETLADLNALDIRISALETPAKPRVRVPAGKVSK